jgi:NADH-quinone oxidoreductase subunit C
MPDDVREANHEGDPDAAAGVVGAPPAPDDDVAAVLVERFAGSVFTRSHGQPVVYLDRAVLADAVHYLRDEEQFTMAVDVTAVDHLTDGVRWLPEGIEGQRFEVVVNLLSHARNRRIRLICEVPELDATVPSITPLFPGADFAEREAFDLFGITFDGHPDLTRILMPDDWQGYPLRKDDAPSRVPVTFKGDPSPR